MIKAIPLVAIILTSCIPFFSLKGQQTMAPLIQDNQRKLDGLSVKLKNNSELALFDQSNATVKQLKIFSTRVLDTKAASADYWGTVVNYNQLIKRISDNFDSSLTAKTLEFISNDMALKFSVDENLKKVVSEPVTVTVKVVDSLDQEQSGYDVSIRYYLAIDETFTQQFNPTNNARKAVLPGWYLVRIGRQGRQVAERSEYVRVDSDNEFIFTIVP
jgi:hypothetical protein